MLQDTDFFTKLEQWSTLGDVLPEVVWVESASPDERYEVAILWRFRGQAVGKASFVIEPILGSDDFRLFWIDLQFASDWQGKGLFTTIVETYATHMLSYGVVETVATPMDHEAERRLATQGFEWRGPQFVLDFLKVVDRLSHSQPS